MSILKSNNHLEEVNISYSTKNRHQQLKTMTKEDKVISLVKGGFESIHDMTIEEFFMIYKEMLNNNPEKLM